ncbi:MAG: sigma-70 family RNA polymerase sigma factor [Actinomycetota bacterium]
MTSGETTRPVLDEGLFDEFYRDEHDRQVRRAFLLLGDLAQAHDVVADAFLAVYKRWDVVDAPGPYLSRSVVNGCRDAARRRQREPATNQLDTSAAIYDRADYLADLLIQLPFKQRAAIVLRFYGGCTESEIAAYLRCRPGTVGSHIHRGLRQLRRQLHGGRP